MNSIQTIISEITTQVKQRKTSIFFGAGLSYSSGLPIVQSLLKYLFGKIQLNAGQSRLITKANLPFESIMETVMYESGLDEIQEIYSAGEPNTNHFLIAKLAKGGYVRIICTTNFDLLLERALEKEGLSRNTNFRVYSSEAEFDSIDWDSDLIKVVKIHGCASKKAEMAMTMQQIASEKYSAARKNIIENIFTRKTCDQVLVLGYSCSDLDLTPHIESFQSNLSNVFLVEHTSIKKGVGPTNAVIEDIGIKTTKNPFKNYQGKRIFVDTDSMVKDLWEYTLADKYFFTTPSKISWEPQIDEWYLNAEKDSGQGVKHHIASRLLYDVAAFDEAKKHYKKAIEIALKNNNIKAYASELGNLGMAHNALGEYNQAEFCLGESIPLCKRIGNMQGLSAQLGAYGNVLHHTGENEKAIDFFKEALSYAEADNDEYGISNILGNMSNAYNGLDEIDQANKCLDRAILLSRKIGNKQAESSQLGIIAMNLILQGKLEESLPYSFRGLEIKKTIGDRKGECALLLNIANTLANLGRKAEAKKINDECLKLAKAIGSIEMEKRALVNEVIIG